MKLLRALGALASVAAAVLAAVWIATGSIPAVGPSGGHHGADAVEAGAASPVAAVHPEPPTTTGSEGAVGPDPKPVDHCARNGATRLVLVSIRDQHAWLCRRHATVFGTAVTTGMSGHDTATPTGRFRIQARDRNTVLYPTEGGAYPVRYWIPFEAPGYGFHDASWQTIPFGSQAYRTGGSHGCVHMPLAAIRFLYRWATIGTVVVIR